MVFNPFFSESLRNEDAEVGGPCQAEMKSHRETLMNDYAISPELVAKCGSDIEANCEGKKILQIFRGFVDVKCI